MLNAELSIAVFAQDNFGAELMRSPMVQWLQIVYSAQRIAVYEATRAKNPQRWSSKTRNWERTKTVHLNPEKLSDTEVLLVREKMAQKMA
ncbi:hypothetical protein [Deefgea salmonis]|uniref:Transposase n=1 Tax=Deefgea salmonis TaxID=2875502 RepID=A0ABS8BPI9_9NEIS|nr:hypothetical protein [Deefgea salmonis]MCB5197542.1 hypothetical protein [Deefgea salmonis]